MEMEKCKVFMFSNGKESFMALLLHSKAMKQSLLWIWLLLVALFQQIY